MIEPGDPLIADIRVGQTMKGSALYYIPARTRRFKVISPDGVSPVQGAIGDRPALRATAGGAGLYVLVHVTEDEALTYTDFNTFTSFVTHKDLDDTLALHTARGLPQIDFTERYSRYAKSLVAVGDGAGKDSEIGLLTELTALANPYTDDMSAGLPVRLTYDGAPRADAQVEVFDRDPAGNVTVSTVRTDQGGVATVPVTPGHVYMLDAVKMRPVDPPAPRNTVWESLWANLTFAVPD